MNIWQKISRDFPLQASLSWPVRSVKRFVSWMVVATLVSVSIAACSGGSPSSETSGNAGTGASVGKTIQLTLVGYAVPKAAHDAIIPKFVEQWKKRPSGSNRDLQTKLWWIG